MTFSVTDMKDRLLRWGVAKPSHYAIYIRSPFNDNILDICLRCEKAELPGKQVTTQPHMVYGHSKEMPYGQIYQELNLNFICSETMIEKRFFDAWQNLIVDPYSGYLGYYDDYVTDIEIYKIGSDGLASLGVKLHEAYPKTVLPLELGYGMKSAYCLLTVTMSYLKWTRILDPSSKGSGIDGNIDQVPIPGEGPANSASIPEIPGEAEEPDIFAIE